MDLGLTLLTGVWMDDRPALQSKVEKLRGHLETLIRSQFAVQRQQALRKAALGALKE